jgi:hypothetical protein
MNWNPTYAIYYGKISVVPDYYHTWPYSMKRIVFEKFEILQNLRGSYYKSVLFFGRNLLFIM